MFRNIKIWIGNYIDQFVRWLQVNFDWLFDVIKNGILKFLLSIESLFIVFTVVAGYYPCFLLGWRIKSWKSGLLYAALIF